MINASAGAAYGWRARVGFITPSAVIENNPYEFYLMAPPGVTIVLTPLGISGLNQQQYDRGLSRLELAVGELVNRRVDAIIQAGVPLVVTHDWGFEDELLARVARVTPLPTATDIGVCIKAMLAMNMHRVAMLSPFESDMEEQLTRYVANAGIEVVATRSLCAWVPFEEISIVPLALPYRAAKTLYGEAGQVDGIWITGAAMPSVGIIDALEQDLGVPVVSSMQAMAWEGMQLAGVDTSTIVGFGRLFHGRTGSEHLVP